jgi:ribonuclease HI
VADFDAIAYTDGACRGNPGIGGWGVRLIVGGETRDFYGGEKFTTNNKMELTAAITALQNSPVKPKRVKVFTDSKYTMDGITKWIKNWKKNGWRTANGDPVKNIELWKELDALMVTHDVTWSWVKGHDGDIGNEKADELANRGIHFTLKRE